MKARRHPVAALLALPALPALPALFVAFSSVAVAVVPTAGAALSTQAGNESVPPAPARWVTDKVGFLSPAARDRIDRRLEAFERSSGHQVIVWIGGSLGQQPLEDWAARTFAAWGVGRKGLDDGAAIFLFAQDRRVRIEVGYGLEDRLTDLRAARIIREEILPRLQRGDRDGAIAAAVDKVVTIAGGEAARDGDRQPVAGEGERQSGRGSLVVYGLLAAVLLFLFFRNPALALYWLMGLGGWGRRGHGDGGWGGGDGGGFSGGGGRSGGGGASGSW